MAEIPNVLPEKFKEIFMRTNQDLEPYPGLEDYVNLNIHLSDLFSLEQVPAYATDLIRNFYEDLPDDYRQIVLDRIPELQEALWPETVPEDREQLPYFLPPRFTHHLEHQFVTQPWIAQAIRSELWETLLAAGYTIGDLDIEVLILEYSNSMRRMGIDSWTIYKTLSMVRADLATPLPLAEAELSQTARARLVQFLLTPYEEVMKLPQAALDDIETYFGKARTPEFSVQLPGWNEIITGMSRIEITPQQKANWTQWRKRAAEAGHGRMRFDAQKLAAAEEAIGAPPLDAVQIAYMRKRWEIAKRINASPTPDTIQTVGNILTFFDDIQDGLVTLTYLGRVGVSLLGRVLPRVALKAVPILGWVSLAKDMMDIMHYIRMLRLARSDKKRKFWDALELLPRSRAKSLRHFTKIKELLPQWHETIQIAQTTDVLFGTGLALGPIVGAIEDVFFGLFTGGTFKFLGREFPIPTLFGMNEYFIQVGILSPNITPASLQAFTIINKASRVLPHINQLPVEVVLNVFTALHYAWCYLAASGDLRDWHDWQKKTLDLEIKTQPLEWHTKEVLHEIDGYPVRDIEPFGSPTHTHVTTPRHLANEIHKTFINELDIFMEAHKHETCTKYICSLINEITTNYLVALNGSEFEINETLQPFPSAIMLLFHYGLDEKLPRSPEQELFLISEIADLIIRGFGKWPALDIIRDLLDSYSPLES